MFHQIEVREAYDAAQKFKGTVHLPLNRSYSKHQMVTVLILYAFCFSFGTFSLLWNCKIAGEVEKDKESSDGFVEC